MKRGQSKDQKRKGRLTKRSARRGSEVSIPRNIRRYQDDAYVEPTLFTECAILQAHVTFQRRLTDKSVECSLRRMIQMISDGSISFPPSDDQELFDSIDIHDFVIWNIGQKWRELYDGGHRLTRKEMIGILATVLRSIECWTTGGEDSQGYLIYVEGFLAKGGIGPEKLPKGSLGDRRGADGSAASPNLFQRVWEAISERTHGTTDTHGGRN